MTRKARPRARPSALDGLRNRLGDAQATLEAIGRGEVDAVIVSGPDGPRARTLDGAAHPYHALLHAMSDGAALLATDGAILFRNRRLGEIAHVPHLQLYGQTLQQLVVEHERTACEEQLRDAAVRPGARAFTLRGADGSTTPVSIALSTLSPGSYPVAPSPDDQSGGPQILMAIVTDLTERKTTEALRAHLMQRVISAEDDERRRIARELHDETGQSLTALLLGLRAIDDRTSIKDARIVAARLRAVTARTIDDVGRLARGLHPSALDDLGLAAAATRYVRDFAESHGIAISVHAEGLHDRRLSPLSETTV